MQRVTRRTAGAAVQAFQVFTGSNVFSELHAEKDLYVVYSYGYHFPLFVHTKGQWYANSDKYSSTTSRHRSMCHPQCVLAEKSTEELLELIRQA